MKYELSVHVRIRTPEHYSQGPGLELSETQSIELTTLSDAAEILVKLHEFFQTVKEKAAR